MAEIEGLVRALRESDDAAKTAAAWALDNIAKDASAVLIAEAGGIPLLVELLRDGSADAKLEAAVALRNLGYNNAANRVLIAEAGAIPPLVQLVRDGSAGAKSMAASALSNIAHNNDANAVAIALAVGSLEVLVELVRRGRVTVTERRNVRNAGVPAKRKAALVVAALLRACVPVEVRGRTDVRDVIRDVIGPYL